MLKHFFLLVIVTLVFLTFALFSHSLSALNCGSNLAKATPTPTKQIIKSVKLDRTEAIRWCPRAMGATACTEDRSQINISTQLTSKDESLEFYYIVSSGEIIGEGKNVTWEFPNSEPGNHTLTVGVGKNEIILSELVTKTVQLSECISCHPSPCYCPDLKFNPPPKEVKAGNIIVLSVESEELKPNITYTNWTIENGEIINGQGTKKILVKVSEKPQNKILKVAVKTATNCEDCVRAIEKEIKIIK